ncbi:hypothetical protein [Gracilibacillus xinjiangensis]|uniref:HTH cro/C1-type domain-containing protein n=1 Tax=Gracilibacillus xinjiangensis TaxID=1193282 RepID=A0ABV8WST6_9BACI
MSNEGAASGSCIKGLDIDINVDRVYLSTLETVCKVLVIDIQELIEVE